MEGQIRPAAPSPALTPQQQPQAVAVPHIQESAPTATATTAAAAAPVQQQQQHAVDGSDWNAGLEGMATDAVKRDSILSALGLFGASPEPLQRQTQVQQHQQEQQPQQMEEQHRAQQLVHQQVPAAVTVVVVAVAVAVVVAVTE